MRRTLAAPGLAAVLGMALLLTACGKTNAHNNTAGETVSTALFDFSITDVSLVESYPGIDIPDGECLVRMRLNIKNTSRDDVLAAHRVPPQLMGMLPNNVGGFGDVEKAAKVFARNEIAPLQARMAHAINTWAGTTVCSFKPYLLEDAPAATA